MAHNESIACKECMCSDCINKECPVPCKAFIACDNAVNNCPDYIPTPSLLSQQLYKE